MSLLHDRRPDAGLDAVWEDRHGLIGFFTTVDHKRVGMRYIYTSFCFFFVAGLLALVMRAQLATPNGVVVGPDLFNQLFTMHGTTMIFLFNTPVLAGFGNYLLPMMIGARDMAFPRLNAFSYWIFLFAGIFIYISFVIGKAPNGGWFSYVPLTNATFSPGINLDFWGLGVIFVGISTTAGAVNFIVTAFKMRAPGMAINQLPIFVWSIIGMAFMVVFSVPVLTVAAGLLESDRLFGTAFYDPSRGGSALLYQHLFWFWGHPEVYLLFLPATGMVSAIIPVFSRRRLEGYFWIASSLIAIAFISFGVWAHHMFATGLPSAAMGVFSAASLVIALPSAILYFAWIGTMWEGRVKFEPPMLFALGFMVIFLLGGITGVMVSSMPFDWQATDSYFLVAHFHYVLNGAVVFPIFGALYFWLPKMTGRMLNARLGKWSFWVMFIFFNVSFFPMHVLGLRGMPRRVYTYHSGLGWDWLNMMASVGAGVFGIGTGLTLINVLWSRKHGAIAGDNPWRADTLEWSTSSPPPDYNFAVVPMIASRHPLWDQQPLALSTSGHEHSTESLGIVGAENRETPVTGGLAASPESGMVVPQPSSLPCLLAFGIAVFFAGLLVSAQIVLISGAVIGITSLTRWAWHTEVDRP
ncbi:MAG: cytochrome c oxidase subunit I [Ilumatobacteraceae bacterium]